MSPELLIHLQETTAREVVMLALAEFGISEPSSAQYSLCEVTAEQEGLIKQKRLPDQMTCLPDRIGLNSRYVPVWLIQYCVVGLAQDCSNSIATALELLQSCAKPSVSKHLGVGLLWMKFCGRGQLHWKCSRYQSSKCLKWNFHLHVQGAKELTTIIDFPPDTICETTCQQNHWFLTS